MPTPTATAISGSRTLHRLIYVSRIAIAEEFLDSEIEAIVAASVRNNGPAGMTGLLLVHGAHFLQALEGPAEAVMNAYRRILDDPRHDAARVLFAGPVQAREFETWHMCARRLGAADEAILATLARRVETVADLTGPTALRLLKVVREIQLRTDVRLTA